MRVTTGRVVKGKIEVPGESIAEGLAVTVLAPEGDEAFTLSPADEAALLAAMPEGDRGEVASAEELLRDLPLPSLLSDAGRPSLRRNPRFVAHAERRRTRALAWPRNRRTLQWSEPAFPAADLERVQRQGETS